MVSALIPGASGLGLSPGRGKGVVFLGKTLTLTLSLPFLQREYKWVVTCDGLPSSPGRVEILLAASWFRNCDKLWQL